jgi:hypothetical protein
MRFVQEPRETLMGTEWHRRTPRGDDWDSIRIVGVFDGGEIGGLEFVVAPVAFGGETITCTPESLVDAYTRDDHPDTAAEIGHRLRHMGIA